MRAFIGTQSGAIYAAEFDGNFGSSVAVADVPRPTFVLADPRRKILYVVSEVGNAGDCIGNVLSFAIGNDGALHLLSQQASGGGGPTHLTLDAEARTLFAANFGGGEVAAFPVSHDGVLSPASAVRINTGSGPHRRQKNAHAHGVTIDPSQRFLLVPDMGADRIFIHRFDAAAQTIAPAETPAAAIPPGSGPRLISFGKDGKFAYLLTELSAELHVFGWHAEEGRLEPVGVTRLDMGPQENPSAAVLVISANGKTLYASNRATDTIEVYTVAASTGALIRRQSIYAGGAKPWCAEISPDGKFLGVTNQASDLVQLFAIDAAGSLSPAGAPLSIPTPTGIAFA